MEVLRYGLLLTREEKEALQTLTQMERDFSMAACIRRLIRQEAFRRGIWQMEQKPTCHETIYCTGGEND